MTCNEWMLRSGQRRYQPRAIDGTVLVKHFVIAGANSGFVPKWEKPMHDSGMCFPSLYRWKWLARLRASVRNRRVETSPSEVKIDGVWHHYWWNKPEEVQQEQTIDK